MVKLKNNITETGIAETLAVIQNFSHCEEIVNQEQIFIPVPEEKVADRLDDMAQGLAQLGKDKLLLFTPEIALIGKLAEHKAAEEIIICLPYHIAEETAQNIISNMPSDEDGCVVSAADKDFKLKISFVSENEIPEDFTPYNAAVVAFGFSEGSRSLILTATYRMMKKYAFFCGIKAIACCGKADSAIRPAGWAAVNTHEFFDVCV